MARIDIPESKIKSIAKTIRESRFFIAGYGHFDLETPEYYLFVKAIMSSSPKKELDKLYKLIK